MNRARLPGPLAPSVLYVQRSCFNTTTGWWAECSGKASAVAQEAAAAEVAAVAGQVAVGQWEADAGRQIPNCRVRCAVTGET